MVTRIGQLSAQIGASERSSAGGGSALRIQGRDPVRNALEGNSSDAVRVSLSQSTPAAADERIPGVKNFLAIREQALGAVSDLRSEQLALSTQAEGLAVGEELTRINERLKELEDEVARVSTSATFNGTNVLDAVLFSSGESDDSSDSLILSVADASSFFAAQDVSLEDSSAAVALSETLTQLSADSARFTSDTSQAQEVVTNTQAPSARGLTDSSDQPSAEEAEALARSIAQNISAELASESAANPERSLIEALAGNLSPSRVQTLLED